MNGATVATLSMNSNFFKRFCFGFIKIARHQQPKTSGRLRHFRIRIEFLNSLFFISILYNNAIDSNRRTRFDIRNTR